MNAAMPPKSPPKPTVPAAPRTGPAVPAAPRPAAAPPPRPAARPAAAPAGSTSIRPATQTSVPARRPPAPPAARAPPAAPPRARRKGRMYWVLLLVGVLLVGSGAGLFAVYDPLGSNGGLINSQTASSFLTHAGVRPLANDPAVSVEQITLNYHAGDSVAIKDTVTAVQYNASTDTTILTFSSIAGQAPNERSQQSQAANGLFATISGSVSWLKSGQLVLMSFTVVQAKLPGGPYGTQAYLTLDAAADATYSSINNPGPAVKAVAIGAQYVQPDPSSIGTVTYNGLFLFMMALGALSLAGAILWADKIESWVIRQTKDPKHLVVGLTGGMALLAGVFMPFYPWWIVVFFAGVVMLVAWRFPQLALLVLVLVTAPEVAYQSGALGIIFLFATIPILYAGLIDWRFAYGALLTLFLAPIGLSFIAPIFFAMIFTLYLGIAVAVAGGALIALMVSLGNLPVLGYLAGNTASTTLVAGHSAALQPGLPYPFFSLNSIGAAYVNMLFPNFNALIQGSSGAGSLVVPLAEVGAWCIAAWMVGSALKEREKQTVDNVTKTGVTAGAIVAIGTVGGLWTTGNLSWYDIALLAMPVATVAAAAGSLVIRDAFEAYFTSRLGASSVGTRVAEMKGLTKVTFEMVGGLHDVKADIKESMIIPLMRKDVTARFKLEPPKGILLFGPPGCGKTMLMKALASELGVEMISIKCSDLMSKWYGESENRVADLLRTARERAPCILFMDEIDAVAKRRDMYTADDVTPRLLSILLSEMDGIDKSAGVIVVGSTNKPDLIDPAMMRPGRLDKIIYVPPPDFNERMEIVHVHLVGRPVQKDVDLAEIAKKTERFSGADLANLVREAATIAVRREMMSGGSAMIAMDDFRQVLPRIKPSISLRMISDYETMKMDYERKMHQVQRTERKITVRWDDVGGLQDIKGAIREYVELPLTRPELMESYKIKTGRGILLFGPPGCGKTHVMRAAANELNVPMQIVNGPELVSALAGQSEAAVRDILYRARENAPSIVFFDEIDALASKDSMKTPEVSRAVSQFLTEMDGLRPKDKVIIIATTNRPQTLDPALLRPGRFDKIFYVPPPDLAARQDIFRIHLKGVPTETAIDFGELARRTDGYSGADIASTVDEAKLIALREQLVTETGRSSVAGAGSGLFATAAAPSAVSPTGIEPAGRVVGIRMENLLAAVDKTKSSITPETLAWAQEFIRSYGTRG
ncbi:MAG TPA: AAA family ATPase [Thermoplasmata archaeon]|nr:AAA family ATPase [Thermoplasmata archaeon]